MTAPAALAEEVSEVRVEAELTDAAEANALSRWPTIEQDLEAAIISKLEDMRSDDGWIVQVKLNEVSLSGAKLLPEDGEFNTLDGWIFAFPDDTRERNEEKKVRITAVTGDAEVPENTVMLILPTEQQFYDAMLDAFAENVVEFTSGI